MFNNYRHRRTMAKTITTDDTSIAAKIKYIGPIDADHNDPQVVLGSFDGLFYLDYTTGTVLDDYVFQASVTAGHSETDKGAANMTWGTWAAIINASDNWRMILVGARPEDLVYTHSGTVQSFLAIAAGALAQACTTEDGTIVYFDTSSVIVASTYAYTSTIGPEDLGSEIGSFLARRSDPTVYPPKNDVTDYKDSTGEFLPGASAAAVVPWVAFVDLIEALATFTTSQTINVYAANQTSSRLLRSYAGAATTVQGSTTFDPVIMSEPGERIIVRVQTVGGALGSTMVLSNLKVGGGIGEWTP